jgi:orotate phosphoribosyltransferase
VITAGTAVREVIDIINEAGATLAGVVIGLDRRERGAGELSAVQEVSKAHGAPVISIITIEHIIDYLAFGKGGSEDLLRAMQEYREQYGV